MPAIISLDGVPVAGLDRLDVHPRMDSIPGNASRSSALARLDDIGYQADSQTWRSSFRYPNERVRGSGESGGEKRFAHADGRRSGSTSTTPRNGSIV